jgi:tetratricopeptide (TPR) repeat protein
MELGLAQNQSGKLDLALQSFENAALLQPQNIDAQYYKGLTLAAQNRYQEALRAFERVLVMDAKNSNAWYAINLTKARLNQTSQNSGA